MILGRGRVAVAVWIVAAATAAGLIPSIKTVVAAPRSGDTTLSFALATATEATCRQREAVKAVHHAGADDALPARHRKLIRKRFRRRFGGLIPSAPRFSELSLADIVGVLEAAHLNAPAASRDHARAPPISNPHA